MKIIKRKILPFVFIVACVLTLLVSLKLIDDRNYFFTQFKSEKAVQVFIAENILTREVHVAEISQLMDIYMYGGERCSLHIELAIYRCLVYAEPPLWLVYYQITFYIEDEYVRNSNVSVSKN